MKRILFIGAGVGNLAAANYLREHAENDFLVLEKGKALPQRHCPNAATFSCAFCKKTCDVVEGVGGANALNGNKLCYFPASEGVRTFVFGSTKKATLEETCSALTESLKRLEPFRLFETPQRRLVMKYYHSDILPRTEFGKKIFEMYKHIADKVLTECNVLDVIKKKTGFEVLTESGESYCAQNVVFGTGRSSWDFLKKYLTKNQYACSYLTQDVGIRIEGNAELFSKVYYYQADPKFKFVYPGLGVGRTFCAHNQGKVVPVRFGDSYFADGAFGNISTGKNNIALMARAEQPLEVMQLEKWCRTINESSGCGLVLGEVKVSADRKKMIAEIMRLIPEFPNEAYGKVFENLLRDVFGGRYDLLADAEGKLTIYGPAIDRYWVKPEINRDFSLVGENRLFVLGDAAGLSRGFVQAMYSGCAWARGYLSKYKNEETKVNDKVWSGGVSAGLSTDGIPE